MPENSVYGAWPRSGEIDIAEFRGNAWPYPEGNDFVSSTLHWGPDSKHDGYINTHGTSFFRRETFASSFHTFGLEWTEKYLFLYLDSRLKQVMYFRFNQESSLWKKGGFAGATTSNGTLVENPWVKGGPNAPFDESFYLILNVAVGAQNGWFFDGEGNKPWVDGSDFAVRDFWNGEYFARFGQARKQRTNTWCSEGPVAANLGRGRRTWYDCQVCQDVEGWQLLEAASDCRVSFASWTTVDRRALST